MHTPHKFGLPKYACRVHTADKKVPTVYCHVIFFFKIKIIIDCTIQLHGM